ncbi:hypothetical protein H6P81_020226 [Aristolochia fimbriata]|uniref:Uncharacterized protein n=1 Tax=Aristolochia fimbriata TaxID=158543 RepID=A0AAV7DV09_ARIFI|nr:hypothetical protein H6P81_020226 [Aristolochia fimbriata]
MSDPKYAYPYPAQGYYQGPPVMAPPQYAAPPPRRQPASLLSAVAVSLMNAAVTPPSSLSADAPHRNCRLSSSSESHSYLW